MEDGGSETSSDTDEGHDARTDSSTEDDSQLEFSPMETSNHGPIPTSRPASSASDDSTPSSADVTPNEPDAKPTSRFLLTNAYRDLLNATISSARCDDVHSKWLEDFTVGYSYWTSSEKEALFNKLGRCSSSDLRTLSNAVATKSESEVFMYLKLLQDGACESHAGVPLDHSDSTTFDTAWEISSQCEETLSAAADALARHISKHDVITEQARHGDDWLLSQDSASLIDRQYEEYEVARSLKVEDDTGDAKDPALPNDQTSSNVPEVSLSPADELLRSSEFLALSRTVFMNSAEADSWHTMGDIVGPCQEPAMYRSAVEKLHQLAVAFTQRLCGTALTQAASRLRSYSAGHPAAVVTAEDVRTACDILRVPSERDELWATCPRRCRLNIYSSSDKYNDGRETFYPPGSHHLARLISYDEAEKELTSRDYDELQYDEEFAAEPDDDDLIAALNGDDFFTDVSMSSGDDETEPAADDQRGDKTNDEAKGKRARPVSQRKYLRLEESKHDAADLQSSRKEVQRLWKLLRLRPPESAPLPKSKSIPLPRAPLDLDLQSVDWRQKIKWIAPWEHEQVLPNPRVFIEAERRERAKRKHREALKRRLQDRLATDRVETLSRAEPATSHESSAEDRNEISSAFLDLGAEDLDEPA